MRQLQRLPHAYSVQVVYYTFEPMGKPIGYNPARLQRAYLPMIGTERFKKVFSLAQKSHTQKKHRILPVFFLCLHENDISEDHFFMEITTDLLGS